MKDKILKILEKDRFASVNGITLIEAESGYAHAQMTITDNHLNGVGMVQGGAIFTLADFAFAAASNLSGNITVSVNANIAFFKSPKGNVLKAIATEISSSKKLCNYNVDIFDEEGTLVAKFHTTGYFKGEY